jgi:hypothetical protein
MVVLSNMLEQSTIVIRVYGLSVHAKEVALRNPLSALFIVPSVVTDDNNFYIPIFERETPERSSLRNY